MRALYTDYLWALLIALVACAATASPAASTKAPAPSPSAAAPLTVMPVIHDVAISPGGKMLAWADSSSGKQHILMYDVAAKKVVRDLALDEGMTFHSLEWSDEETLLYTVSATEVRTHSAVAHYTTTTREYYRMFSIGITDTRQHMMLNSEADFRYVSNMIVLRHHISKPNTIIVTTYAEGSMGWVWTVFAVDTHTGKSTRLETGDQNTRQWVIDHDGQVIARSEWYPLDHNCTVLAKRSVSWPKLYETPCTAPLEIVGLDSGETAVLSIEGDTDGRRKLWAQPLDGSPRKVVAQDPTLDVRQVLTDINDVPTSAWTLRSAIWLDPAAQQRAEILTRSFPKRRWRLTSESADHQLEVLRVYGPSIAPSYFLVNLATHQATPVGDEFPDLTDRKLGDISTVRYKSHDGTELTAYLTLPPQAGNAPLPLVVLPHGGPHASDNNSEFEWLRQHLATRGYAVLQPQFRGSSGFGAQFEHAGDRQWGLLMQDDLTDGVHALIDQGRIDPHRICILGDSSSGGYAGYAALAGAAFTPDIYKCAISVNGIADLPRYLEHLIAQYANMSEWGRVLGDQSDPALADRSPIHAADRITAPILLVYSADDSVVPPNQSQSMAESLKNSAKSVQLVEIPHADHTFSHPAARLQSMEVIDRFLEDHL